MVDGGRTSIIADARVEDGIVADVESVKGRIIFEVDVEEKSLDGMLYSFLTSIVDNAVDKISSKEAEGRQRKYLYRLFKF